MKLHTLTINVIVRLSANVLWADNSQIHKIFCIAPLSHQGFLKGWCDKNFYLVKSITLLFASVNLNVHKKHCKPHVCRHICTCCKAHVFGHGNFWLYYKTCISMVAGCFLLFSGSKYQKGVPQICISQTQNMRLKLVVLWPHNHLCGSHYSKIVIIDFLYGLFLLSGKDIYLIIILFIIIMSIGKDHWAIWRR